MDLLLESEFLNKSNLLYSGGYTNLYGYSGLGISSPYHTGDVSFPELFRCYGYEYEFRTSHVADVFHVKNSRANLVIRELTAAGILESPHYATYRFFKPE